MKGWIIYNGSLEESRIETLIRRLKQIAESKNLEMSLLKNNQILAWQDGQGNLRLTAPEPLPDFVIFWDKDILLAKHLEKMGIRLFNSAIAIGICDDKVKMQCHLSEQGIAMPKTIFAPFAFYEQKLTEEYYEMVEAELNYPLVLKEASGSFGMQVYLIGNRTELKNKVEELKHKSFLLQEFISGSKGRDIRVNIVGKRVVGAMLRENDKDFRANMALGGRAKAIRLTKEQEALALKVHKCVGLDFSGVDLLFGESGPILCEVNSNVNFLSFERTTGIDFGEAIIDYIIGEMECKV